MELTVNRAAPWVVAACALLLMLRGLLVQAGLQADLNSAMQGVLENVAEAGQLTEQTATAMAPLASTARTLERMNGHLWSMGQDLADINGALERVSDGQERLLDHLGSLNNRTSGVAETLFAVDAQNRAMQVTNANLSQQTEAQASALERLSVLTDDATHHLGRLNERLAFLR